MAIKLGMQAKLYFKTGGVGGGGAWTEMTNVKDVTLNLEAGEADVTTRANNGWRATIATLRDGSVEWEMVWDTADAGFTAIKNAYFNGAIIGLSVMDGDIATKQVTDEDFGRAMAGDAIDHATTALLEELVSFFPSPRDRANLQRVLQATWRVMDKARDMIEKRIDSGEIERLAEQALAQPPKDASDSSGGSPVSSASTPPP